MSPRSAALLLVLLVLLSLPACAPTRTDDADPRGRAPESGGAPSVYLGGSAGAFFGATGR